MRSLRPILVLVLGLVALGGGFAWGYLAHRDQIFPYDLVLSWVQGPLAAAPETPGRWRLPDGRRPWINRDGAAFTAAQLEALGYAQGSLPASDQAGVTINEAEAWPSLALVTSGHAPEAQLIDLDGTVVHRWVTDHAAVFPDQAAAGRSPRPYFRRARMLPDGGLLAMFVDHGAFRLDRDGAVVWAWEGGAHHDLVVHEGQVWLLGRELRPRPSVDAKNDLVDDEVVVLDLETGDLVRRFTLLDALEGSNFGSLVRRIQRREDGDVFHTNTLRVLDGRFADANPAFEDGNLMLSMRHTDWVLVVDPDAVQVVWAMAGPWSRQHEPTLVEPGRLLVFDNMGAWPRSRVLEVDPVSQRVEWAWDGGRQPLISETCGTAARLPNGNTMVVASDTGRAEEVTRDGRVVWRFFNPARAGDEGELVATLFQVERLAGDALGPWAHRVAADVEPESDTDEPEP